MSPASSALDRLAARLAAGAVALAALGLAVWLVYIDNREDPRIAACIRQRSATIERARDSGGLAAEIAGRFLARVAASCRGDFGGRGR
jgi:hypothetical protein